MRREHFAIVHFVDMIAGENQHELRRVMAQDIHILKHRIRRALVPLGFDALLRRQQIDKLIEFAAQKTPAALQVLDQAMRFVLGDDADAADARIQAIGKRKINDAEFSAKRHRRFRPPIGQVLEPAAAAAGQDKRDRVFRQQTDEAGILFLLT